MSDPRERLTSLVELATQNAPEKRRELAVELCDLLLDWPANYPQAMREPFETLLEKTVRLLDIETRAALIARISDSHDAPLGFLNEFFFDAPQELRRAILQRNSEARDGAERTAPAIDERDLVLRARGNPRDAFAEALASALDVTVETAGRILHDGTAQALAVAAKGAHLSRATFSALALLADGAATPDESLARLSTFETVPLAGAENMLNFWRGHCSGRASRAA
jgi:hypothetical protein